MPQPLTLSRAAKLARVTRSELQEKLRTSGLNMFEGKIAIGDLLSLYPEIDLDRDPVFERIERIEETARPRRDYSDGWMPQPEVLLARLNEMQSILVRIKVALDRGESLRREISRQLKEIATRARLGGQGSKPISLLGGLPGQFPIDQAASANRCPFALRAVARRSSRFKQVPSLDCGSGSARRSARSKA